MKHQRLVRKLVSWIIGALGGFLSASALLLAYAAVGGGYYPTPFDGLIGHLIGALFVALGADVGVAAIFWFGLLLVVVGYFAWPTKK